MGGKVNVAIRFRNGEAICQDRWTNNMPWWFQDPKMFAGDEDHVRAYIAATAENDWLADPYAPGKPVRIGNSEYGLIVWDFMTNTILDNNGYSDPISFDPVHTGGENIRETFVAQAKAGRIRAEVTTWEDGHKGMVECTELLSPDEALRLGKAAHEEQRAAWRTDERQERYYRFLIDPSPMTYLWMGDHSKPDNWKKYREKLLEIGFPMTRKEGLNRTLPEVPRKRAISEEEKLARELLLDFKGLPEGQHLKGISFDQLDAETRARFMAVALELLADTPKLRTYRIEQLLSNSSRLVTITIGGEA